LVLNHFTQCNNPEDGNIHLNSIRISQQFLFGANLNYSPTREENNQADGYKTGPGYEPDIWNTQGQTA
jgi:hypothetical protein